MIKIGRNDSCPCGSSKKYKKCCLMKDEEKTKILTMKRNINIKKITRKDFLSKPFEDCPECRGVKTYGLDMMHTFGGYTKECFKCGYSKNYKLPELRKKIIYLDQFVISNLVKLLDPSHKSHNKIKEDPFWEKLFIKLEKLQDANLIICPDTFYHREESIASDIPFFLMERLYEHFSDGKTLVPHLIVYRNQIRHHFEKWLKRETPFEWDLNPQTIGWENFNEWCFGLKIRIKNGPRPGEREQLLETNQEIKDGLVTLWSGWTNEEPATYKDRVDRELLGFKKLLFGSAEKYLKNREETIQKSLNGEDISEKLMEQVFSPLTNDILEDLVNLSNKYCTNTQEGMQKINDYLNDPQTLIQVPGLKISSLMYAGLAHRANKSGQKNAPKSLNDVHFISAYLPYCDAMFIDKECATILKEVPRNLPEDYKVQYSTKIFSLANKEEFLDYLDDVLNNASAEHMQAVKDIGTDNQQPYWDILTHEKAEKELDDEQEKENLNL